MAVSLGSWQHETSTAVRWPCAGVRYWAAPGREEASQQRGNRSMGCDGNRARHRQWVFCGPRLPETSAGHFIKAVMMVFASIICVVSFPVWLHFIFTGFISPSWLEVGHCRREFNSWRRLNIIYSILPYVFSSFATAWLSLSVEKSETVSISSVFSLGMCFSWKVYSSKPFNCPCLLLRTGMPS